MKAHRLLELDRRDLPRLRALSVVFIVSSASTVMLASLSKALFLARMPIGLLPWMFLGSALLTVISSLVTVAAMRRWSLKARFSALLSISIISLIGLRVAYPAATSTVSVAVLLWCPAVGHLTVLHAWNVPTTLLATRQAKRLVPVLAAITTVGAVAGGLLVQGLLAFTAAENLLLTVAALMLLVLFQLGPVFRALEIDPGGEPTRPRAREERGGALRRAHQTITAQPLLRELTLAVFLLQASSLIIDYQLSAELQPQLDKEGIASFLGGFYWMSNVAVLLLALGATGRLLRMMGIGLAIGASALMVATGSLAYLTAHLSGWGSTFWVIAATAFAERVAQYAFTKPAMQMVYMPMSGRGGEHAKTVIDGVVHRSATLVVSALLILASPELQTQFRLSPPTVLACVVVIGIGLRLTPHYRRAIFEALSAGRLDPQLASYLRAGLGRGTQAALERRLDSDDDDEVIAALDIARDLDLPLPRERLLAAIASDRERVSAAALRALLHRSRVEPDALSRALDPTRPPRVLQALLGALGDHADPALVEPLRPLTTHADPSVATAACVLRIRAAGAVAADRLSAEIRSGEPSTDGATRYTGMTRARDFARELPELLGHPDAVVRRQTVEQMGALGLPCFIEPLIGCLAASDLRSVATQALCRCGPRVVDAARVNLTDSELPLSARSSLLTTLARMGSPEALGVLLDCCEEPVLRDRAVGVLWQWAADDEQPVPEPERLRRLAIEAIAELEAHAAVEAKLAVRLTRRHHLFFRETERAILRAEERALRLVGVLTDRDAVHRAFLHYRSAEPRARSNAIELLDQTLRDDDLKKLVRLVERAENEEGVLRPRSIAIATRVGGESIDALVERCDRWVGELWRWCQARGTEPLDDDPLDRAALLSEVPFMSELGARALSTLAGGSSRRNVVAGDVIQRQQCGDGSLHVLLEGSVALQRDGRTVATLTAPAFFGAIGSLDGAPQPVSAVANEPSHVVTIEGSLLDEVMATEPRLLRGLVAHLAQRVRRAIATGRTSCPT